MTRLHTDFAGIQLRNPIIVAAGEVGIRLDQIKDAEFFGAGAFITKGCIPGADAAGLKRKPRFRLNIKTGSFSGVAGFRRQSLNQACNLISKAKKCCHIPIGANIFAMTPSDQERELVTRAAASLCKSGADFIELDTSGNLPVHFGETQRTGMTGEYFVDEAAAHYTCFVHDTIKNVKEVVDVPVLGKIAYENLNVPSLLSSMEIAGVDLIDVGNAGVGILPGIVDIYNPDKVGGGFVSADRNLALCITGNPLRAISQAYLIRSARQVRTPILGCGGIMNWKHIVEAIMCGATATAVCTAFMIHGFGIIKEMTAGLHSFMEHENYHSINEFKGKFLEKIALTPSEISIADAVAVIDSKKCNGCGLCAKPAHCGLEKRAISLNFGKAYVDKEQCSGCETCVSICPLGAVTMRVAN
jgi:dihydropyrimidine dehydrogenase (NAD+) subunit PreA